MILLDDDNDEKNGIGDDAIPALGSVDNDDIPAGRRGRGWHGFHGQRQQRAGVCGDGAAQRVWRTAAAGAVGRSAGPRHRCVCVPDKSWKRASHSCEALCSTRFVSSDAQRWIWFRYGSDMVRELGRSVLDMVQIWFRYGP